MFTNFLGSSFLIIAVFVIRALFARGTSRRFIYALWLIVLVRLLMPMPIFDLGIEIPLPISHDIGETADRETYYPPITAENPETSGAPTTENITPPQPVSPQPVEKNIDWAKVFNTLHIAGAGALALWFSYVNISLYTRLKKDRVKLETSHNLPVYKTNVLTTPCLFGVIKPAIYLTEAACDERHINNVITHEMCHYRHWDNLWNFLGMVCVVMWWWNPLVWLSFFTAKRDGELACDELALEILGENGSRNYGVTLIEMTKNRPHHRLSMAATISGGAKEMKERIMAIANKRKNVIWAVAVVAVIAVLCIVIGFSGAEKGTAEEKYQTVADVLNKYAVQYNGISGDIYTYAMNPHQLTDYEINKYYDIIKESGVDGLMENIIDSLKGNRYADNTSHKIVTTLPLSEASDNYRAYDLLKNVLNDFYRNGKKNVFDKDGENITDKFLDDTYDMYKKDDWGGIIAYFKENVGFVREDTVENTYFSSARDRRKWIQTEYLLETINTTAGEVDVVHGVTAWFNYNPENKRFSDMSAGWITNGTNYSLLKVTGGGGSDASYLSKTESIFMCRADMTYSIVDYNTGEIQRSYPLTHIMMLQPPQSLDTTSDENIDRLFNAIVSEPLEHSSTEKYISAHKDEYEQLLSMNKYTLSYAFRGFEANVFGFGLKAEVIARVCDDIVKQVTYETPQIEYVSGAEWYAELKAHARNIEQSRGRDYINKYIPWAELLLDITENMGGFTPVLIRSFDGETMVIDPVEYITTADTERIAELELDPALDLPSGYYIHNETEESISLKVSGAVFEFVDWNRQFTEPDADLFYETSSAAEFLEYCGTYDGGIPANTPFFLNINGNNLLKLKEIILA